MAQGKNAALEGLRAKVQTKIITDEPTIDSIATTDLGPIAREEAFMHEKVTIMIMATTDANAPPYADVSVNGQKAVIRRNQKTVILRKHLEVLARMRETRWVQESPEGYTGAVGMESLRGHSANVYPFSVLKDDNPLGAAWLEHILSEAA